MSLFGLETSEQPYGLLASVSGEIDLSTVGALEEELRGEWESPPTTLVVDLREVTFLDSSGLRLILTLNKEQSDAGRRLVVVEGGRRVARVFELTGAAEELETVADPSEIAAP
jgi:anti-sigma B factor antagonist